MKCRRRSDDRSGGANWPILLLAVLVLFSAGTQGGAIYLGGQWMGWW